MSGVFSVLSDQRTAMFRLQQAKKPWEQEIQAKDAKGQLAQKAENARKSYELTPKQQSDHATARAALEEARRVGGPKAAAQERLDRVERRIEELKLAMRYAHGDRQKLTQLAREAALLAREAGKAAKEYATGVANAAEMGLPGGAGASGSTEITRTTTVTTLTVQQTEVSVSLTVKLGSDGAPDAAAAAEAAPDVAVAGESGEVDADQPADGLPPDLARMVDGALSGLRKGDGFASSGAQGDRARALMRSMMTDNDMKMSRFREADGFGRRVEGVLRVAKQVLSEAKAANELDESEKRRKERREGFKADEKMIDGAQKEVNALRQAAFGSKIDTADALSAVDDGGSGESVDGAGAGEGVAGATTATPTADAPLMNVLA